MQETELKAHAAALLVAARHVVEAYRKASLLEQDEAIDRLRRIIYNVERQVATSSEELRVLGEVAPRPGGDRVLARKEVPYYGGHRIPADRERVAKSRIGSQ